MNEQEGQFLYTNLDIACGGNFGLIIEFVEQSIEALIEKESFSMEIFSEIIENIKILNNNLYNVNNDEEFLRIAKEEVFTTTIPQIVRVNNPAYEALKKYINLARNSDLDTDEFVQLELKIKETIDSLYRDGTNFNPPNEVQPYLAIIGPSFMGKTQTAFNLSRKFPVLYVNFTSTSYGSQSVYLAFKNLSNIFYTNISADMGKLRSENVTDFDTKSLLQRRYLKLKTIGLIWSFVLLSRKFNFDDPNQNWFEYYLSEHEIVYEALSVEMFWIKMSKTTQFEAFSPFFILF